MNTAEVTTPDTDDAVASEDGRRLRRDRNRAAVVDALLQLYEEGNLQPSSDEIAVRAGLSPRSLFRYFDDIDDLCRAAISRQQERVLPLVMLDTSPEVSLDERIAALVKQRVQLFEAIGSVGTVSRLRAPFQPLIAEELGQSRHLFRAQIKRLFATELSAAGPARGPALLSALDLLCSFESYQLLRDDQRLSRAKAAGVLTEALTTMLQAFAR